MNSRKDQLKALDRLLTIMDELREQCPWDKKQTMQSLRHLTIEETYELGDAILDNDLDEVKKELGDVLLHIVFYSKIGSETKDFDIADVANSICDKLIDRHPHIYGDVKVENEEDVKRNWENLKLKEGKSSVLEGVPKSLPALVKASRIQDKVSGVGFDWEEPQQVFEKLEKHRTPGTLITSNTSGIPIKFMSEGRSEDFQKHFCGTHFFNPPRYLELFEIIPGPKTDQDVLDFLNEYGEKLSLIHI